ncbi:monocyte to macrophage differentiation factor [Lycorma delicatula]|uniref:monocyte to macrophage differentiation factor n=1 Tax=Lycorma delicatula TaxID=130591 RepID=UPI003F517282
MPFIKYLPSLSTETFNQLRFTWPRNIQWKNERAKPDQAYVPTTVEHLANVVTHGIWILPSIYGCSLLLKRSSTWQQYWAAIVYGMALVLCFGVSTVFHTVFFAGSNRHLKDLLHRGDRAMIYVFIAASYFPWLMLRPLPADSWVSELWWVVWVLAFLGILYQQIFHERYKSLETFFYLFLGVAPSLAVINEVPVNFDGLTELKFGGFLYVIGVFFFKSDGAIPFAHAIWHLFVASAASVHYFAILHNLYNGPLESTVSKFS